MKVYFIYFSYTLNGSVFYKSVINEIDLSAYNPETFKDYLGTQCELGPITIPNYAIEILKCKQIK